MEKAVWERGYGYTWKPISACAAMWYHMPFAMLLQLPKKCVADLCLYQLQLMHLQMHVHTGINNLLRSLYV